MTDITGASLRPIYDRLHGAPEYHPLEADTFADWSMEAGDIVTITREGKNYTSPVHNTTIVWRKSQQVKVSSTGKEERGSIAKASQKKAMRGGSILRHDEYMHYYVEDQYHQMQAGLEATASTLNLYVDNKYAQMRSGLDLTSSTAHLYTDNKYAQMRSGLALTTSTALLYVDNKYAQMQSGLALTTSTAMLYVDNKYAQMQSGLALSASTAMLYVDNKYTQMQSGLMLTSSTAKLYTDNKYTQMSAGLTLGVSFALMKVNDSYNQMKSALYLTSSDAHLYVDNKYAQMQSGLIATSSSAMLYTQNRTTRAYIMTRINADGEGEALIEADKVLISGATTISGALTISDGILVVKKTATFQGNIQMPTADSFIQAPIFGVPYNGKIRFNGTSAGETYNLTTDILKGMVKEFSVSGNTLTLTPFYGDPVNFSKATTLAGSWGSGSGGEIRYRVVASPQGSANYATVFVENGTASKNANWQTMVDIPVKIRSYVNGSETAVDTGYENTLHVNVNDLLQAKTGADKITANGTYTADSDHIGLGSVEIDVPGYTEGQNSVNIIKGSWDTTNARIQFSKSAGTANTQGVQVGASKSWSNGEFTATIKDYYDNQEGVDTGYRVTTDIGTPSSTNPAAKPSTESIAGRTQIGTSGISKAGLSGPGYIFFSITVRGKELKYYITVNP